MKKAFAVAGILSFVLAILVAIPALIPDEDYTPGTAQWLKEANNPEQIPAEQNRFYALAGFFVAADKDMIFEGEKLIKELNQQLTDLSSRPDTKLNLNTYWKNPPLQTSKDLSDLTSKAFEIDPAKWLAENKQKYNSLLETNSVLLERLNKLMLMENYSHTMKLHIQAPFILFNNFLALKRLHNLSIIHEFINSKIKNQAISRMIASINFSRRMMGQSGLILDKMVATTFLKNDLLTYSHLLDLDAANKDIKFTIKNLHGDETSMIKSFKGEFAMLSTSLSVERSYAMGGSSPNAGFVENFALKYYVKPKKLENNSHKKIWMPALEIRKLSLAARKIKAESLSRDTASWWDIYTDPIGYILFNIASPSYFPYMDKVDHVDATITLLNLKSAMYANNIPSKRFGSYVENSNAEMNSGYKGAKFSWDKDKKELSYTIPDYENKEIPKINLKISNGA